MSDVEILEGAEEFELGSGPVGALLVHGFTGSPQGMRALGEYLADNGIAVVGVRLPGHGTTWQELNTKSHEDWTAAVEDGYDRLAAKSEEIFIVGLSFGASLALNFAAKNPHRVKGLVLLASWVMTKDPRRFLAPFIRLVLQSLPGAGNDIADPEQREIVYERVPTRAAYSMLKFTKGVRKSLSSVRCPALLIHSHNDHTAHPDNAPLIHDAIGSTDKEIVWVDGSYHVITVDVDRDEIYRRTLEFIKERADAF
ncbi:MAG: alpha/beta fold hydrolase [Actinomycetota bacterium]|nr:alpha/beta fold hydrolase [Actinomycetota bacterium]